MRWRLIAALPVAVCALAATTVDDNPAWAARDDAQESARSALENAQAAVDTLIAGYEDELEACRTALAEARAGIITLQRNLDEAKTRIAELEARLRPPAAEVPPLGIFCGAVSEGVLAEFAADENVEPFIIMTNWCFDPGGNGGCGTVDLERLADFVEQMMPDPCGDYWVCFDAENTYTDRIKQRAIGSPEF